MKHVNIAAEKMKKMKALELREKLQIRGEKIIGKKDDLRRRLLYALEEKKKVIMSRTAMKIKKKKGNNNMMDGFVPGA